MGTIDRCTGQQNCFHTASYSVGNWLSLVAHLRAPCQQTANMSAWQLCNESVLFSGQSERYEWPTPAFHWHKGDTNETTTKLSGLNWNLLRETMSCRTPTTDDNRHQTISDQKFLETPSPSIETIPYREYRTRGRAHQARRNQKHFQHELGDLHYTPRGNDGRERQAQKQQRRWPI